MSINYSSTSTPDYYKCSECGAANRKLWRRYMTSDVELLCIQCVCEDQGKDARCVDGTTGRFWCEKNRLFHDAIGWFVPAIPDGDGNYWGYTSVPEDAIWWWRRLPVYAE